MHHNTDSAGKKNDLCCPGYTVARTTEAGLEYYKAKTPHEKRKKKAMDDDKWTMPND